MEREGEGEDRWGYIAAGAGHHRRLPMWRTNEVLQILHSACGCVQDDTGTASSMVTRNVFLSTAKNLLQDPVTELQILR